MAKPVSREDIRRLLQGESPLPPGPGLTENSESSQSSLLIITSDSSQYYTMPKRRNTFAAADESSSGSSRERAKLLPKPKTKGKKASRDDDEPSDDFFNVKDFRSDDDDDDGDGDDDGDVAKSSSPKPLSLALSRLQKLQSHSVSNSSMLFEMTSSQSENMYVGLIRRTPRNFRVSDDGSESPIVRSRASSIRKASSNSTNGLDDSIILDLKRSSAGKKKHTRRWSSSGDMLSSRYARDRDEVDTESLVTEKVGSMTATDIAAYKERAKLAYQKEMEAEKEEFNQKIDEYKARARAQYRKEQMEELNDSKPKPLPSKAASSTKGIPQFLGGRSILRWTEVHQMVIITILRSHVVTGNHVWRGKTLKECFIASDAVSLISKLFGFQSRKKATKVGEYLRRHHHLECASHKGKPFADKYLFFRFTRPIKGESKQGKQTSLRPKKLLSLGGGGMAKDDRDEIGLHLDPSMLEEKEVLSGDPVDENFIWARGTYKGVPVLIKRPTHRTHRKSSIHSPRLRSSTTMGDCQTALLFEARTLSNAKHPYVVDLVGVAIKTSVLAMEWPDGGTLHHCLLEKPKLFALSQLFRTLQNVTSAMAYLHAQGPPITHGNLSIHTVLLFSDPENGGFISKVASVGSRPLLSSKDASSNARWRPPESLWASDSENLRGMPSPSADVFAFGSLVWACVTRTMTDRVDWSRVESILKGRKPSIPESCPQMIKVLIESCWASTTSRRISFQAIEKRLQDLQVVKKGGKYHLTQSWHQTEDSDDSFSECSTVMASMDELKIKPKAISLKPSGGSIPSSTNTGEMSDSELTTSALEFYAEKLENKLFKAQKKKKWRKVAKIAKELAELREVMDAEPSGSSVGRDASNKQVRTEEDTYSSSPKGKHTPEMRPRATEHVPSHSKTLDVGALRAKSHDKAPHRSRTLGDASKRSMTISTEM